MENSELHAFQNPLRLLFEFDITNQNYPRLHLRYLLLSNPGLGMGKLLIQSLEWLLFIISAKLIILQTMKKTTGKIPSATCEIYSNRNLF